MVGPVLPIHADLLRICDWSDRALRDRSGNRQIDQAPPALSSVSPRGLGPGL